MSDDNSNPTEDDDFSNADLSELAKTDEPIFIEEAAPITDQVMEEIAPISEDIMPPENIINEPIVEETPMEEVETPKAFHNVHVNFSTNAISVDFAVAATGQTNKMVAANGKLQLMSGKFYMIPVNCEPEIDSDDFANVKVYSDVAELFDVRYVKNGIACVMPLRHNITLSHDQRLCVLF